MVQTTVVYYLPLPFRRLVFVFLVSFFFFVLVFSLFSLVSYFSSGNYLYLFFPVLLFLVFSLLIYHLRNRLRLSLKELSLERYLLSTSRRVGNLDGSSWYSPVVLYSTSTSNAGLYFVVSVRSALVSYVEEAARDWGYTQGFRLVRVDPSPYPFSSRVGLEFIPSFTVPADPGKLAADPRCWAFGVRPITYLLDAHTFLAGRTGSGKTTAMRALIYSVRSHRDVEHVAIVDPKGFDYVGLSLGSLGGGSNYAGTPEEITDLLVRVRGDVDSTYKLFRNASLLFGIPVIDPPAPRKYLFIDEVTVLDREQREHLDHIMRYSRSAGWVVVIASQFSQKEKVPFREHCSYIFSFTNLEVSSIAAAFGVSSGQEQDEFGQLPSNLRRSGVAFVNNASRIGAYLFNADRDIGLVYFIRRDFSSPSGVPGGSYVRSYRLLPTSNP